MSWQKVSFSSAEVASGKATELQEAFTEMFIRNVAQDAGMFSSKDVMANDYFFSPGAVRIASLLLRTYGGVKCQPPRRSEMRIIVAHDGTKAVPFASEQ